MSQKQKLNQREQADLYFDLINAFAMADSPLSAAQLLQDLLTPTELYNLSKRLRIAKLLEKEKTYQEIINQLKCSHGTIAKVKAWLEESEFRLSNLIKKLPKRRKKFKFKRHYHGYGLPQILIGSYLSALSEVERERLETFVQNIDNKDKLLKEIETTLRSQFKKTRK